MSVMRGITALAAAATLAACMSSLPATPSHAATVSYHVLFDDTQGRDGRQRRLDHRRRRMPDPTAQNPNPSSGDRLDRRPLVLGRRAAEDRDVRAQHAAVRQLDQLRQRRQPARPVELRRLRAAGAERAVHRGREDRDHEVRPERRRPVHDLRPHRQRPQQRRRRLGEGPQRPDDDDVAPTRSASRSTRSTSPPRTRTCSAASNAGPERPVRHRHRHDHPQRHDRDAAPGRQPRRQGPGLPHRLRRRRHHRRRLRHHDLRRRPGRVLGRQLADRRRHRRSPATRSTTAGTTRPAPTPRWR